MGSKSAEDVYDDHIQELREVLDNSANQIDPADKQKIKDAAELIDSMQMDKTGRRDCKVGSTIPG